MGNLTTYLPAPLAEIVRIYGLRNWVKQGYKQMKDELGWADFMVRSDRAIRRHWTLVCCVLAFCWCMTRSKPPEATRWYPRSAARGGKKTGSVKVLPGWPRLLRCSAP